jgi:AraC-like DNA-binding protein
MAQPRASLSGMHAMLAPGLANIFEVMRVGATVWDGNEWYPIHVEHGLLTFELEHGVEHERDKYNMRCMSEARRTKKPVRSAHAGLSDLFVPIVVRGKSVAILATGPFATTRATSAEILERWRWLTGRQGHPSDPEFAHYLSVTLSTLVLEGQQALVFERLMTRLARLMAGEGRAGEVLAEAEVLRDKLEEARSVDLTWESARSMVDERTTRLWASRHRAVALSRVGLSRAPELALVGLVVSRDSELDPVEDLLRRDAFQRACVELARTAGDVISGQVGYHGVSFLSAGGSGARRRQSLLDLGEKAATLARRRYGLTLHLGVGTQPSSAPLSAHYEAALEAAEAALSRGVRLVNAASEVSRPKSALGELRRQLGELVEERADSLPARFDGYLEAVALRCGYRLEPARAHLEAGFERMAEALLQGGALEEKSFLDMSEGLERAAQEARTVDELFAAYRHVVSDMSDAVRRPVPARRSRSLQRAVAYIHKHYREALGLVAVSRVAGFAPNYFSALFKQREGMTFERYVRQLRIERAKQLLASTDLDMQRIAQLSGLGTRQYLARMFRRVLGMTPLEFRLRTASKSGSTSGAGGQGSVVGVGPT